MTPVGPIGFHAGPAGSTGTPPAAPVITGIVVGSNDTSVVVSLTGTDTLRLFYRVQYATTWLTGLTRSASGDITQTGLSAGTFYEFYAVADDGSLIGAPSNVAVQKTSGLSAAATALGSSPAFILSEYIINEISALTNPDNNGEWPLYTNYMPDGDDVESDCAAMYDTAGILNGRLMRTGEVIKHPGLQLRLRSLGGEIGYAKIEGVALSLDSIAGETLVVSGSTFKILNMRRTTEIIPLGLERGTKRRFLFTVNYLVTLKKVA